MGNQNKYLAGNFCHFNIATSSCDQEHFLKIFLGLHRSRWSAIQDPTLNEGWSYYRGKMVFPASLGGTVAPRWYGT